jgi:UDP-N-acetylmuramoylalanine--D-glutamate ligase
VENYKTYFKGKSVTVLGLGLLGKRLGDIQFLSKHGAHVTVTDLKSKKELTPSIRALKGYKNIKFVLGEHRLEDFSNQDFILKGQGTPLDSIYIKHARENGIPIEMDESLFMKLAPGVILIGVTGTRGKTYTTELIYHILKKSGKRVFLGGNIKGTAALKLLPKVKKGDIVVFELSSWQLQGFGEAKISPQISVFTSFMPDHMNYYKGDTKLYFKDKSEIFNYQKKDDILVIRPDVLPLVKGKNKGKLIIADSNSFPKTWKIKTPGEHTRENASCAVVVVRHLKIPELKIKNAVESFKGVSGRLEFVKNYKGVKIYNDTCATTPEATVAGLKALVPQVRPGQGVILIAGGTDKNLDPKPLVDAINKYSKEVILLSGSGTDRLVSLVSSFKSHQTTNLKDAVKQAVKVAKKGDIILFSPGFASFGMFKNEYDRGDQFMKIVKGLK